MKNHNIHSEQGMILADLICGIGLFILIVATILTSLHHTRYSLHSFESHQRASEKVERIFQLLEHSFRRANFYRGIQGVIWGTSIEHLRGPTRPMPGSILVSFLELSQKTWLKKEVGSGSRTFYCRIPLFVDETSEMFPPTHGQWLGLGVDGYWQVGTNIRRTSSSDCAGLLAYQVDGQDLSLFPGQWIKSLRTWPVPPRIDHAALLIPITQSYTLVLDEQGVLRRVSIVNRENQPIVDGIESFTAEELPPKYGRRWLRFTVSAQNSLTSKSIRRSASFSIPEYPNTEFLELVLP